MILRTKYCLIIVILLIIHLQKVSVALAEEQVIQLQNAGLQEIVLALKINYVETNIVSTALKAQNNDILVPLADFQDFELKQSYIYRAKATINNIDYLNISKLPDIDYKLDEENLILIINFPPLAMPVQNLSIWHEVNRPLEGYRGIPIRSFYTNYDLTVTHQSKDYHAAGVQEFNYSDIRHSINQTVFTKQDLLNHKAMNIVRLDTTWTKENEDKMVHVRIGDSITSGAEWSSSTRFGGLQYATDFSLRPNMITYPLIEYQGRADIPSALDVYANSQLIYKTDLKTGEYSMNNLPVTAGQGALEVKQKDITGKLQTIVIPYYIAPSLLKEGLSDYAYEVGSQRVGYGTVSNKYRYLITNFDYNRGINSNWTAGAHFESMKNIFALGTSHLYKVGNYGIVSGSIATSGPRLSEAHRLMLGYSFQGQVFSLSLQQMISGRKFMNTFNLDTSGIKKATQGAISYSLSQKSSIGFNYINASGESNGERTRTELISVSYQNNLTRNSSLRVSAGADIRDKKNKFVALSFGINLGSNYVSTNVYHENNKLVEQVGISSNSREYNGLSYSGNITKNATIDYDAQIQKSFPKANATFYFFKYGKDPVQQLSLQGAVAATSNGVFFARTISDSFAIAKVGNFKDVKIYHNNQFITKTSKNGTAFIPNVPSYIDSKIRIDEHDLPLTAQFAETTFTVNAQRKSGVMANFDITKVHIAELALIDANDKFLTQDLDVKIEGLEEELFVGYDGKVYIPNVKDLKEIKGSACKEETCCNFNASLEGMENIEIIDLGVLKCH